MSIYNERKTRRTFAALMVALLAIVVVLSAHGMPAYAEDDIPESGVAYTLTYPDGTKVIENAKGEPLSYSDVQELLKPANWKKMAEGLVSDANGKVKLDADWNKGTIRIVETKVPAGYTQGTDSEKTAELEDGSAEFVNPKEKDPTPESTDKYEIIYKLNGGEYNGSTADIVEYYKEGEVISIHEAPERKGYEFDYWKGSEYQPGDSYTVTEDHTFTAQWTKETTTTTTTSGGTKTGDGNNMTLYILIEGAAAAIFSFLAFKKKKVRAGVISMMLIGVFAIGAAYAAEGFVINKIDDNGDPVKGAVFDVYGKPEVTWEDIMDVTLTKTWNDDSNRDAIRPDANTYAQYLTLKADGTAFNKAPTITDNKDNTYTVTWKGLDKYSGDSVITYTVEESAIDGYTAETIGGNAADGFTLTNTHTPETITISGAKTWTSSTGNNDDLDTSKIPTKYTVRLEKSTDGTSWTTVASQEVSSYMAPLPAPTDPILPTDQWTFDNQPKYENGVELQYRCVEDPVPDGFTMSGGTKDANGKYNITNVFNAAGADGVNFNFVFASNDSETVPWIVKTKDKTVNDFVSAQLDNGTIVYKYLCTYEGQNETYYCQYGTEYPSRDYDWYATLEASSKIEDEAIKLNLDNAVPVKEDVEKTFVYGCFKPDVTKNVSISGTKDSGGTYSGSFNMTLGTDKAYNVDLEPGTYEVIVPFASNNDIDVSTINSGEPSFHAWDNVTMVTTIKLTVSRNTSDELECTVDSANSQFIIADFSSETEIDTENIYSDSMDSGSTGIGLSASGNTVNITNYLHCSGPNEQ